MTQNLVSTAPGTFTALLGLVQTAANAQNPPVNVFAFELGQYEPGSYVTVELIDRQTWTWAYLGSYGQYEEYDITGRVSIFSGDSVSADSTVVTDVLSSTYTLFQALVMTPVMSNRTVPVLGASPNIVSMTPNYTRYSAGPGEIGGEPGGWFGSIAWSFHFKASVTPA